MLHPHEVFFWCVKEFGNFSKLNFNSYGNSIYTKHLPTDDIEKVDEFKHSHLPKMNDRSIHDDNRKS